MYRVNNIFFHNTFFFLQLCSGFFSSFCVDYHKLKRSLQFIICNKGSMGLFWVPKGVLTHKFTKCSQIGQRPSPQTTVPTLFSQSLSLLPLSSEVSWIREWVLSVLESCIAKILGYLMLFFPSAWIIENWSFILTDHT